MVGSPTSFGVFCTCPRHFVSCIGHLSAGQTLSGAQVALVTSNGAAIQMKGGGCNYLR